jgi:uncharacterized protein (TIGR02246 family)
MSTDEQAIRQLVETWHRATASGDVPQILQLMTDDVVFLVAGQEPMRGRASFESSLRGLLQQHRIESSYQIQEIAVSDGLAYCWNWLSVNVTPLAGGAPVHRTGNALTILRKRTEDGAWLVVRDANLLSASPGRTA